MSNFVVARIEGILLITFCERFPSITFCGDYITPLSPSVHDIKMGLGYSVGYLSPLCVGTRVGWWWTSMLKSQTDYHIAKTTTYTKGQYFRKKKLGKERETAPGAFVIYSPMYSKTFYYISTSNQVERVVHLFEVSCGFYKSLDNERICCLHI